MCKTWRWRLRLGLVHLRGEWLLKQAQRCHQLLLQGFDQVVTISNQMRQSLLRGGARSEKVSVIRNWVDLTAINSLAGPNALRRELGLPPNIKIVLYAGSIGVKQALHIVMEVAERLVGNKEFLFVVAGEGPERDRLVRLAGSNIQFYTTSTRRSPTGASGASRPTYFSHSIKGRPILFCPPELAGMLASGRPILVQASAGTELSSFLAGARHAL